MTVNHILPGNCIDTLKTLPDCSVDRCVTYQIANAMLEERGKNEIVPNS